MRVQVSRGASGFGCSILGSIMGFVFAPDNVPGALENLADPQCKIVSLTITEKGYCFDPDGNLDFSHPLIVRDLADVSKPGSALGYIIAAVRGRHVHTRTCTRTQFEMSSMPDWLALDRFGNWQGQQKLHQHGQTSADHTQYT